MMIAGAVYYYLDFWSPGLPVEEKIWLDDSLDEENLLLENIYLNQQLAKKAGEALLRDQF
jgi:hypothetical protein